MHVYEGGTGKAVIVFAPPLEPRPRFGAAPPPFSKKAMKQALRNSPKGSGAAVGGARWEHWCVVLASTDALTALHEVCVYICIYICI